MIQISEKFNQYFKFLYKLVTIVFGGLINADAMNYNLKIWFPDYDSFRELFSCFGCLDF